eukprot:1044424-Prymnesium_polylepis.2
MPTVQAARSQAAAQGCLTLCRTLECRAHRMDRFFARQLPFPLVEWSPPVRSMLDPSLVAHDRGRAPSRYQYGPHRARYLAVAQRIWMDTVHQVRRAR